jgi:hypothetical protein
VSGRKLLAAWVATVAVLLIALGWTVYQWMALGTLGTTAGVQNAQLSADLDTQRQVIQKELLGNVDLLKEIRWSPERGNPDAVVRRLAELVQGGQAKVLAIAPLERESTARYRKSWHRIEMAAPYRELVDLAAKVEHEGGILEEVVLDMDRKPGDTAPGPIRAQFRLSAMEPSEEAKRILDRAVAAARKAGPPAQVAALTLPIEERATGASPQLRDPFAFVQPASARSSGKPGAPVTLPGPVALKGIVKFPGGNVAIVNDQVVRVGDVVDGQRVEEISDGQIVLRQPGGGSRTETLPGIATVLPGPKKP